MYKRIVLFFMFLGFAFGAFAQETDTTKVEEPAEVPVISYSSPPKKYKIADIFTDEIVFVSAYAGNAAADASSAVASIMLIIRLIFFMVLPPLKNYSLISYLILLYDYRAWCVNLRYSFGFLK